MSETNLSNNIDITTEQKEIKDRSKSSVPAENINDYIEQELEDLLDG